MDRKKEVTLAVGAKNMIKLTGLPIVQSSVSGYMLVFAQIMAELVQDRLVAETRAVLLVMVVIMGRQQARLGEKEIFVVDCQQKENVNVTSYSRGLAGAECEQS